MCLCNPKIKSIFCDACKAPPPVAYHSELEERKVAAFERIARALLWTAGALIALAVTNH